MNVDWWFCSYDTCGQATTMINNNETWTCNWFTVLTLCKIYAEVALCIHYMYIYICMYIYIYICKIYAEIALCMHVSEWAVIWSSWSLQMTASIWLSWRGGYHACACMCQWQVCACVYIHIHTYIHTYVSKSILTSTFSPLPPRRRSTPMQEKGRTSCLAS
jgi:hypothetical protein